MIKFMFLSSICVMLSSCHENMEQRCLSQYGISSDQVQTSISSLTNQPSCYDNRYVEFSGVMGVGHGASIVIYPTMTDFKMNNVVTGISINSKLSPMKNNQLKEIPQGTYVTVRGTFISPYHINITTLPTEIKK